MFFLPSITATTIAVYRGNTSVVEYISAGAMAGGLYKLHLGAAATLVGAGLGMWLLRRHWQCGGGDE